ncbi:uncharacterized protein LOC110702685 [Chenopodium quinoa]|uniref:uncharacterized protein LOC110702685 n=1 Tax=Chenopodium quinoa TaxID=63459 RepID=UPI000B79A7EE|nr:uncharacterized protein LOC110702685 [Chenopodium quinoa]XP_021736135.1 uncharacterized protein LOC110702685 [Chenopodium quinoa]
MKRKEYCNNSGQFSTYCLENSSGFNNHNNKKINNSRTAAAISSGQQFPLTHCRCGGGFCKIKITPKTQKLFYTCPNVYELHCGYFKFCEDLKEREISHDRPKPYPICSCGAGVCRVETEKEGLNSGRKYFACRIKRGEGACNFRQWQCATAYDNSISNEIEMIRKEFENGEIDLDFPPPLEEALEINSSGEMFSRDNDAHHSPQPSPSSPLDVEALAPMDLSAGSRCVVVRWLPHS